MEKRKKLIIYLFKISQEIYIRFFKRTLPWNITSSELIKYPKNSFGYRMGFFLQVNGFELIPKVESHDALHVLAGMGTKVEDEIALQFLCFGNGKRSPYLLGVMMLGSLLLPEYFSYYITSYKKGIRLTPFYNWDFKALLNQDFNTLIFQIQPSIINHYKL